MLSNADGFIISKIFNSYFSISNISVSNSLYQAYNNFNLKELNTTAYYCKMA